MRIRLAGVFAHPDDDVYILGGSLLLNAGRVEPSFLFATNGGAGPISEPHQATRETLGTVREGEQRAALAALGYGDARADYLGHPDYYLPDVPMERLVSDVESFLRRVEPHIVVTFGPDGYTSHHDHMAIGAATTEAYRRLQGTQAGASLRRLYHAALRRSDVDRFYEAVHVEGYDYGEEGKLFDITGVPDEAVNVCVDTSSVRDAKFAAILEHRTQMIEHMRFPESLRWIFLDSECFVRVDPPADGSVQASLFHDAELSDGVAAGD